MTPLRLLLVAVLVVLTVLVILWAGPAGEAEDSLRVITRDPRVDVPALRFAPRVTQPARSNVTLLPSTTTTVARSAPSEPWDLLAECESNGRWDLDAAYDGGLQFHPATWRRYRLAGMPPFAYQATREQQIAVARRVQKSEGWGAWPVCSRKVGVA